MTAPIEAPVTPATQVFWDATRTRELLLPWCSSCSEPFWFPREVCPRCLSDDIEWRPSQGDGVVYSVSVMNRAGNAAMVKCVPYAVALIELSEGVRMMAGVATDHPNETKVGDQVVLTWEPLSDGRNKPMFTPSYG